MKTVMNIRVHKSRVTAHERHCTMELRTASVCIYRGLDFTSKQRGRRKSQRFGGSTSNPN